MGLFNFLKSKKNVTAKRKVFLSDNDNGVSFEKAEKLRIKFIRLMSQDKRSEKFNIATSMILSKAYDESIDCYKHLLEKYPDTIGECQSQIGACYYFKKEYKKAIEYYLNARKNGANENTMDDNVWEAYVEIYKKNKDVTAMLDYLEYFPEGRYKRKAAKFISK